MQNTGFLVRFIDIGLIILFGFIWVSDISTFSHIDMSGDDQQKQSEQTEEIVILRVSVGQRGVYSVVNRKTGEVECSEVEKSELERCLGRANEESSQRGRRAVVLIEPSEESAVQHTVNVLDICQRLGIPKNINKAPLQL
ncbi:ExbD/TolR family protein [Salinibacter ruber]|jgi:biopolymer transport protein ExbD|uniref:ExbD/TolR family protein n=1 Tax=Salinibacter ruber TaxID=146919 RepID=UPI003C6E00E7